MFSSLRRKYQMQSHAQRLASPNVSVSEKIKSCAAVKRMCHGTAKLAKIQMLALTQGVVEGLIEVVKTTNNHSCCSEAYWCLGMLSFSNEEVALRIGQSNSFIDAVRACFSNPATSSELKRQAIYPCQNVASYNFKTHEQLSRLVPMFVQTLTNPTENKTIRGECVIMLNNLAYNPLSRPVLLENGALLPLVEIMKSEDMELVYPLAAIAVANITAHNQPELASTATVQGLSRHIVGFFRAALNKQDYPTGSGMFPVPWKAAMAVSNLSQNAANATALDELGIVDTLKLALSIKDADSMLLEYSLQALWRVQAQLL
eukprot:c2913_g1_i1.p1 GENE.c2913_g1_i1~~c2913_g1_i1.p1  ORF type:complete len:316 (-),score=84.56 c2913_g1_i1:285-1232(-)